MTPNIRMTAWGARKLTPVNWIILNLLVLLAVLASVMPASAADEIDKQDELAREILMRADRIRFPEQGFQVDIVINSQAAGREDEMRAYRILSKGNSNTLVQTTAPPVDRGQILLMRDRDLWAFLPNLSQPIRLPLSQRLTGQVANGDLARANFVGDYTPRIQGSETIDGEAHHILELKAVDRWVTYNRVLYWVNARNHRPRKAEFYTLSGRLLKTAHYQGYKTLGGATRPTQLVIDDALREGNRSVLEYSNMRLRDLEDRIFTRDYLRRLSR